MEPPDGSKAQARSRADWLVPAPFPRLPAPRLKTCFIVNLRSGRAARIQSQVRALAAELGATVRLTERVRHAATLAADAVADRCELVVAVGGDGTMNEIAGELVGTPAILGLVPCGSGDGLGRHLGIHGRLNHVFEVLRRGQPRTIDSGTANGHAFFSIAGVGLEAQIAERFNQQSHRGFTGYLRTGTLAWFSHRPEEYVLEGDDGTETFRATTIAIANSRQYGNNAYISPTARVDDGALDLVAIPPGSLLRLAGLCRRLINGTLTESPHVIFRRGPRFVLRRAAGGPVQVDGEVFAGGATVEFGVRPASLRVLCPAPLPPS